ncbi:uncharacterized protein LOC117333872 [Pecten maximus]|uniref:uncharacterized protein LOC117333872 n=1 Tax=Pecten maximus TaxID=6579 RepID=UPI0014587914|nr:uncharacterized protein LOC117333872 [Pecten maximus]
MAALLRSSCRIGTCMEIVARVLSTVHLKERCRCCPVSRGRQMSFTPERTGVHRNLQIKSTKQHKYDLEHKKRSPRRLEAECPEILIENLVTNLKKNLNQQLWNVSYESVLAIVIDLKNKVVEDNRTFKLSAKSGKELLDMITTTMYLSTEEKSTLTGLIWQIINSIPDFEFAESHFTSYVMACSESNIQISISDLRQKMADSSLKSGEEFLKAVLCYHCSNGELNAGCQILQEMKDAGMTINGQCFKYLVTAYTKTGSVSAEDMLSIMRYL